MPPHPPKPLLYTAYQLSSLKRGNLWVFCKLCTVYLATYCKIFIYEMINLKLNAGSNNFWPLVIAPKQIYRAVTGLFIFLMLLFWNQLYFTPVYPSIQPPSSVAVSIEPITLFMFQLFFHFYSSFLLPIHSTSFNTYTDTEIQDQLHITDDQHRFCRE